ncbi:hypothetical protein BC938DRAFT_481866 [Jimgerdemannia flammicorona]|uniref:SH3 domain-containing protein n=1 Tax=Jimgerdemannia flammicorona TaxID=994334 RepID=A0A433QF97_9FUNG|nr:hypothetical protein BC938DRAFT_481866 [Jimgerdemannia flammicorona]
MYPTHPYATHILTSIHRDLTFLKDNNVISQSVYHDIVALLPQELDNLGQANGATADRTVKRPPLPARNSTIDSTSSTTSSTSTVPYRLVPMPAPRRSLKQQDQPKTSQPTNTYERPTSTYERPTSTYERPTSTYEKPSSTYERPSSTYERPSSTHSQHRTMSRSIQEEHHEVAPESAAKTVEAQFDFVGDDPMTDLSLKKGEVIQVTEFSK